MIDQRIVEAWRLAGAELGVRLIAPYEVKVGDEVLVCEAFLPDFGSRSGAVALSSRSDDPRVRAVHWASRLEDVYAVYDRTLFADTPDDWGWYGAPRAAPDWYKGRPWC